MEPERGVEPLAYSLRVNCSTTELLRRRFNRISAQTVGPAEADYQRLATGATVGV